MILAGWFIQVNRNNIAVSVYEYDDNGNRLSNTGLDGTVYGTYDDQDRMLKYGNADYSYTANGSLKYKAENEDTTWYHYDLLGNLMSVSLPNGDVIEYLIDGQNRRVGKKVNGVLKKQWLYQDQLNPVAELDGYGNLISRFVYGSKGHVPDYMISGGVKYRIISDHLGSVRLVVNVSTGDFVQHIDYNELGNVIFDSNSGFQPFGYAGGLYDINTELVRFGARDYDAGIGRWTTKDPIGFFKINSNLYEYVLNDPINLIDPLGYTHWSWHIIYLIKELLIKRGIDFYDAAGYQKRLERIEYIRQIYNERRSLIRTGLFDCLDYCRYKSNKNPCLDNELCKKICWDKWRDEMKDLKPIESWLRNNPTPLKINKW